MKWLVLLLLCGCASMERAPGIYGTSDFMAYTDAYLIYKEANLNTGAYYSINIAFGELDAPTAARCYRTSNQYASRDIVIDKAHWVRITDEQKLLLVFHELGHCDMNFEHQEDGVGIMNEKLNIRYLSNEMIEAFFLEGK